MALPTKLSRGALNKIKSENYLEPVVLQITSLDRTANNKVKVSFSDGQENNPGVFASQLTELADSGAVKAGTLARLNSYSANKLGGGDTIIIMVTELEVISQDDSFAFLPATTAIPAVHNIMMTPKSAASPSEDLKHKLNKTHAGATPRQMANELSSPSLKTPTFTPGPSPAAPPSSSGAVPRYGGAAVNLAPLSHIPVAPSEKKTHGLEQINPYEDHWCIKVKVSRKSPILRAGGAKGGSPVPKFIVELVDATGKQIQATFWRAQAERYQDLLQENKVYLFSKFQVKPANKAYSSVNNDYEIHFSDRSEVWEAANQDTSAMTAAVSIVPIEQLLKHVTRKAPVDVLGVVTALGPLGTIKRKADNMEVHRREVTLVDQGGKSVSLTIWGDLALGPEADALQSHADHCILLQCSGCRVTDYNGCSLSSLSKSILTVDPESPAAEVVKTWWSNAIQGGGGSAGAPSFPTVGGGGDGSAPGSGGKGSGGSERGKVGTLAEVATIGKNSMPSPDAKPIFTEVRACASIIKTDQNLWYLAHPETGRKVVQQGDGYYCEHDGSTISVPQHRYVFSFKLCDFNGEAWANIFGKEAETLLEATADQLVELKSQGDDEAAFTAKIKAAQWNEWDVVIASKAREYNGESKMRHTVHSIKPIDYLKDSRRLLDLIKKY